MKIQGRNIVLKMRKLFQGLPLFIFFSSLSFAQSNLQDQCNMKMVGEEFQFIYEDSVQIVISFKNNVNLNNDSCKEILLEGYSNYIPRNGINVICILTIDGSTMNKFDGIDYYSLFRDKERQEIIDHIIAGYVYDVQSEYNEVYFGSERVNSLFKLSLKKGLGR